MARKILHRESRSHHSAVRDRVAALQAEFPNAAVTFRRAPRYGDWNITVSIDGEAKLQTRGHCQFCGNDQVVRDGVLVLHGYERPGHGWVYGRCPGVGQVPLQTADDLTRRYLAGSELTLADLTALLPALEQAGRSAIEIRQAQSQIAHFSGLLALNLVGTPLLEVTK